MTIFRSRGFDTLIGKHTSLTGELAIAPDSTAVVDGDAYVTKAMGVPATDGKVYTKTTLQVNGYLGPSHAVGMPKDTEINVHNVIITGKVICDVIHVEGTLAVKSGATLKAKKILYRKLVIETGAVVHGEMFHLDHVSEGEQV